MSKPLTQDQLRCFEVLAFLKDGRWCKGHYALLDGEVISLGDRDADQNCFWGAWVHLYREDPADALDPLGLSDTIFQINDSSETYDELCARMQKAFGL